MTEAKHGRCLCGATRWRYAGQEHWAGYCHCRDCQLSCAAPVAAYIGVSLSIFEWVGAPPRVYASSPGVERRFCGSCGAPMSYQTQDRPDEIHLYAAALETPARIAPQFHIYYAQRQPWLEIADTLPKYPGAYPE